MRYWGQQRVHIAASLEVSGRRDTILSANLCCSSDIQLVVKVLGLLSFSVTVVWCVTQVKSPNYSVLVHPVYEMGDSGDLLRVYGACFKMLAVPLCTSFG